LYVGQGVNEGRWGHGAIFDEKPRTRRAVTR